MIPVSFYLYDDCQIDMQSREIRNESNFEYSKMKLNAHDIITFINEPNMPGYGKVSKIYSSGTKVIFDFKKFDRLYFVKISKIRSRGYKIQDTELIFEYGLI